MDMIMALTACSAGESNNFTYKPIDFEILDSLPEDLEQRAGVHA